MQKGDIRYSYDANGNRITEKSGKGLRRFAYSEENILTRFVGESGDVTSYSYDALNRRIAKISAGRRTDYRYDGLAVFEEVSPDGLEKIYNRARSRIISQQQYSIDDSTRTLGKELYYAYDALGSVVALTSSNGKTETRYHYDAFGKLIDGDISENEYTYTGQRLDPESGLYHFHFRQYDADAGVWTTPDPIGILGGLNLYGYVGNNPLRYRDILGLGRDPDDDEYNDCCGTETEGYGRSESDNEYENSWEMSDIVVTAEREDTIVAEIRNQPDSFDRLKDELKTDWDRVLHPHRYGENSRLNTVMNYTGTIITTGAIGVASAWKYALQYSPYLGTFVGKVANDYWGTGQPGWFALTDKLQGYWKDLKDWWGESCENN